jgi:hypothetical protein
MLTNSKGMINKTPFTVSLTEQDQRLPLVHSFHHS